MCRSPGRIVETVIEDITELNGGGLLTVIVQNVGSVTADYAVRGTHTVLIYMYIHTAVCWFCMQLISSAFECMCRTSKINTEFPRGCHLVDRDSKYITKIENFIMGESKECPL